MLPLCAEEGLGVLPWSPLARGLLAGTRATPGDRESRDVLKVEVQANEVRAVRVFVTLPPAEITAANMSAAFVVATPSTQTRAETTFLSGAANAP